MNEELEKCIEMALTRDELKLIRDSLKGALVRENDMNFEHLQKITKLEYRIEDKLKNLSKIYD